MSHFSVDRTYWEQHLTGREFVPAAFPDLPPEEPAAAGERGRLDFAVSPRTTERLLALSNGSDLALFTLLQAGLRQLLYRYTGRSMLALGTSTFTRTSTGPGSNEVVVMAGEVCSDRSFKETLLHEREIVLRAREHQDFPVAHALAAMGFDTTGESFGVTLTLRNVQEGNVTQGLRAAMSFSFGREATTLRGQVNFAHDRYCADYIAQIVEHLDALLFAGCSNPNTRATRIEFLAAAERSRLLTDFSHCGPRRPPVTATIVSEFETRAAGQPGRVALACEGAVVSYGELNHRANRLAHFLRENGLVPEERVALHLGRSIDAVVAMLAVLKAGGVYLPLDPSHPPERIRFMLEDAGVRVVIAGEAASARSGLAGFDWIDLDADSARIARRAASNPCAGIDGGSLAYVLFTSGTTGTPKGVQVTHRGVVQLVKRGGFARLGPDETFLLQSSLLFDASTFEIWGALLNGARLAIARTAHPTIDELARTIRESGATILLQTTALFHLLVDEQYSALETIREMLVGGDVLSGRHARQFLERCSGRLVNVYGPTENTVISTVRCVTKNDTERASVPIGGPIGDTEIYILDREFQPLPVGAVGEIYLGGDGLARDYLGRRGLTAERFLPHPFSSAPGARLYRSGDLGRFLSDGRVEFCGRVDGQVKIRGFRIELSEIETLLCEHPAVKSAAVLVDTDQAGTKRLLAVAVTRNGASPSGRELQDFLGRRLPAHQIPAAFYFRDELPTNRSGKLDRAQLRQLLPMSVVPGKMETPRNRTETIVAEIWRDVLRRSDLRLEDDFFAAGGDSLLAMQVLARINKAGLRLSAKLFFRQPTIAACAAATVLRESPVKAEPDLPGGVIPLTPVQRWFFETHPADPHHFNLSALFDLTIRLEPHQLAEACVRVIRRHDAFQMVFSRDAAGWRANYAVPAPDRCVDVVDLATTPEADQLPELERRAQAYQESLDIEHGPLLRFVHFDRGGAGRDRLLVVAHHLVIDAVSWRIVLDDLDTALTQLRAGRQIELSPPTDRFGSWADRLAAYRLSRAAAAGRAYWLDWLSVPKMRACSGAAVATRKTEGVAFSEKETKRVLLHAATAQKTMEELLLAALLLNYCRQRGTPALSVMLDRHGRFEGVEDADVSRTVGWFTAFCPVYLELGGETSFAGALGAVLETLRRIPNRGFDFSILRYLGQPEERARLSALPQPEASLNYQGEFDHELRDSKCFRLSSDAFGAQQSPRQRRPHALEIDAYVVDGKLGVLCAFDSGSYTSAEICSLLAAMCDTLRTVATIITPIARAEIAPGPLA